ncbi:hypothetical protein D1155_09160 [Anaerotruncus sp. 80]|uniref:Uncharacterized protein n=1 Tax=Anaerotruncus colihominis TaxID=169435 RepID=A0A845QP59_9FIRM|nr:MULTISPECIES: hypothetical protein [Anaerotruncus]NBH61818.1 hypothetical protein [Anaerotruncus colihominis]NCF02473.1 hypothetical protein [Anaerotruncus sp. 80]
MFSVVHNGQVQVKEPEKRFQMMKAMDDNMYEADDYRDLVAILCGTDYYESQSAETDWHMRVDAAKELCLALIASTEVEAEMAGELGEDEELDEFIILYDERIGKIPYSLTGPDADYDIHVDNPELIRVESDKNLLWTLEKAQLIAVFEYDEDKGDYIRWLNHLDLDEMIAEETEYFRQHGDQTRMPLFKKLEE